MTREAKDDQTLNKAIAKAIEVAKKEIAEDRLLSEQVRGHRGLERFHPDHPAVTYDRFSNLKTRILQKLLSVQEDLELGTFQITHDPNSHMSKEQIKEMMTRINQEPDTNP